MHLHARNDGGGLFKNDDGSGYYYVSNSESGDWKSEEYDGGFHVLKLDIDHNPVY